MIDKAFTYYEYESMKMQVDKLRKDIKILTQCASFYAGDDMFTDLIKKNSNFGALARKTLQDLSTVSVSAVKLETIDEFKYRMVTERLEIYNGNKKQAAKSLDIHVNTMKGILTLNDRNDTSEDEQ